MNKLLPCPFCGSDKIEVIYDDGFEVGCKDCSTYISPFLGAEADDKQKHIDFWNSRNPNLVKRSVLENLLTAFESASGSLTIETVLFNDRLLKKLNAAYEEAREELQRTEKK